MRYQANPCGHEPNSSTPSSPSKDENTCSNSNEQMIVAVSFTGPLSIILLILNLWLIFKCRQNKKQEREMEDTNRPEENLALLNNLDEKKSNEPKSNEKKDDQSYKQGMEDRKRLEENVALLNNLDETKSNESKKNGIKDDKRYNQGTSRNGGRHHWSKDEKNSIERQFSEYFKSGHTGTPGRLACLNAIAKEPILSKRDWSKIKHTVRNMIISQKRKQYKA